MLYIYFEQTFIFPEGQEEDFIYIMNRPLLYYIFPVGRRLRSSTQVGGPSSEQDPPPPSPPAGRPPTDDELGKFVCLFREESYT